MIFKRKSPLRAFTLVEIMIVVAIIGLLASIAIPNYTKARNAARLRSCQINLKQIEGAKEQWALESKAPAGAAGNVTEINAYMKSAPTCPADGQYTYGPIDTPPSCSAPGH